MHSFVDGIYLLNKQHGFTSFAEIQKFQRLFGLKKVGHAGTLDKFATGLLILATGKYTKILEVMLKLDKIYDFLVDFSFTNETLDLDGKKNKYFQTNIDYHRLKNIAYQFRGEYNQAPPVFSALKLKGKRLSDLARSHHIPESFNVPGRRVFILNIRLLSFTGASRGRFLVHCSSGTYIRSLGRDIGEQLQAGGVIINLCRRKIGAWKLKKALSLDTLFKQKDRVTECRIPDFELGELGQRIIIPGEALSKLKNGIHPELCSYLDYDKEKKNYCFIYNNKKELVGLGILVLERNRETISCADNEKIQTEIQNEKFQKKVCQKNTHSWKIAKLKVLK